MNRTLQAALGKLRLSSTGILPGSGLSPAQRRALERFAQATGSVQLRPNGRGVVYEIIQPAVVERHWRELSPVDLADLDDDLPNRARNIATSRSSKSAQHQHEIHYLLLKASSGPVTWQDDLGNQLDLRQSTDLQGAAALTIQDGNSWTTSGTLWLVENQALFDRLDWLPESPNTSVAYYSGQLRNGLIDWLAAKPRATTLWFFPDYDGVGLLNYARIKARLGNSIRLWIMPDWEAHLTRFGNAELWQATSREFHAALIHLAKLDLEPDLMTLIQAMQRNGLALEQETVWLQSTNQKET